MKNIAQAIDVAVIVRDYVRSTNAIPRKEQEKIMRNYEKVTRQLHNLKGLD